MSGWGETVDQIRKYVVFSLSCESNGNDQCFDHHIDWNWEKVYGALDLLVARSIVSLIGDECFTQEALAALETRQ